MSICGAGVMMSRAGIRRQGLGWVVLILLGSVSSVFAQQDPGKTPLKKTPDGAISFEFNDPNPWVHKDATYSVYIDAQNTIIWRSSGGADVKIDPMKPTLADLEATGFWYAGEASNGALGRVFVAERPILVRPDSAPYKFGVHQRRDGPDGAHFVVYDALKLELKRGHLQREIAGRPTQAYGLTVEYRARHLDRDAKEVARQLMAYEHRLWVAEDLPNSPAFSVPFRSMGRLFVEERRPGIGEHIAAWVDQQLRDKGLVLGVEMRRKGGERPLYVLEATNFKMRTPIPEKPPIYPVMEQSEFHKFLSLLSLRDILGMVDAGAAQESEFSAKLGAESASTLAGSAVYGSNADGDFALLFRVSPEQLGESASANKELFLLIMRPMHGQPQPGTYQAAQMPENIASLSPEELEALSAFFTVIGLVREQTPGARSPGFHALWGVKSGEITFVGPDHKADSGKKARGKAGSKLRSKSLSGRIELTLSGVKLGVDAQPADLRIEGTFTAADGLENVGSSKITQALRP